jgi:XisH protein
MTPTTSPSANDGGLWTWAPNRPLRHSAERLIAVEVKSFVGPSPVSDLGEALGQYLLYKSWLARTDPERTLYLAIDTVVAVDVFGEPAAQVLVEDYAIRLLVVDVQQGRISQWRE